MNRCLKYFMIRSGNFCSLCKCDLTRPFIWAKLRVGGKKWTPCKKIAALGTRFDSTVVRMTVRTASRFCHDVHGATVALLHSDAPDGDQLSTLACVSGWQWVAPRTESTPAPSTCTQRAWSERTPWLPRQAMKLTRTRWLFKGISGYRVGEISFEANALL